MASKVFRTPVELKNYMQVLCDKAIENACNRLLGALQKIIIDEFYEIFEPDFYIRSYQFWKSATTDMLNKNIGVIFMDDTAMNYNSYWTGKKQLLAASIGSHGGWVTDETKEHRFWEVFEKYCAENAIQILKEELSNVGLKVK
jgi:hypothetical protein